MSRSVGQGNRTGIPDIPKLTDMSWQSRGSCVWLPEEDVRLFFKPAKQDRFSRPESPYSVHPRIRQICGGCPVQRECLKWALDNNQDGVWGGVDLRSPGRRKVVARDWNFPRAVPGYSRSA